MSEEKTAVPLQEFMGTVPRLGEIPEVYFNGFRMGLSNSDIKVILLRDNQAAVNLNMSFTTAKTLLVLLEDIMTKLEQVTNHKIMTTMEVNEGLQKLPAGKSSE